MQLTSASVSENMVTRLKPFSERRDLVAPHACHRHRQPQRYQHDRPAAPTIRCQHVEHGLATSASTGNRRQPAVGRCGPPLVGADAPTCRRPNTTVYSHHGTIVTMVLALLTLSTSCASDSDLTAASKAYIDYSFPVDIQVPAVDQKYTLDAEGRMHTGC